MVLNKLEKINLTFGGRGSGGGGGGGAFLAEFYGNQSSFIHKQRQSVDSPLLGICHHIPANLQYTNTRHLHNS